jgi:hypothetical protein
MYFYNTEILGSHSSEYLGESLLGCDAMYAVWYVVTNILEEPVASIFLVG